MKTLITGASGFIGFHSTSNLLQSGNCFAAIDNISESYNRGRKYGLLAKMVISQDVEHGHMSESSLFPGYIFIRMNPEDSSSDRVLPLSTKAILNNNFIHGFNHSHMVCDFLCNNEIEERGTYVGRGYTCRQAGKEQRAHSRGQRSRRNQQSLTSNKEQAHSNHLERGENTDSASHLVSRNQQQLYAYNPGNSSPVLLLGSILAMNVRLGKNLKRYYRPCNRVVLSTRKPM